MKTDAPARKVWSCLTHGEFFGDKGICPKAHVTAIQAARQTSDLGWKLANGSYTSIEPKR